MSTTTPDLADPGAGFVVDDQLCFAAYSASRALTAAYRRRLSPLGLTYTQYLVLLVLWEHPTIPMRDLGRTLDLDSGTLTPVLQRMEAAGLLERRRGTEDERTVVVKVTVQGEAMWPVVRQVQSEIVADTGLSTDALAALREDLRGLTMRLDAATARTD